LIQLTGQTGTASSEDIARLRNQLGLDKPLYEQYIRWAGGIAHGDFGLSMYTRQPVIDEIKRRFPVTFELAILSSLIAVILSLPLGVISAMRQDSWVDYIFRVVSIGGIAIPMFWTATIFILILVLWFNTMPPLIYANLFKDPLTNLQQFMWPAFALGYNLTSITARMTRSCVLEALRQDYVRTARAKGLREISIIISHVLKNAMIPVLTLFGMNFAFTLGGTVIMENIFSIPGIGQLLLTSIQTRDYVVLGDMVLLFTFAVLIVNLLTDIAYLWFDPRIRY